MPDDDFAGSFVAAWKAAKGGGGGGSLARPKRSDRIYSKSESALIAAIEAYNEPTSLYSAETFFHPRAQCLGVADQSQAVVAAFGGHPLFVRS